MWSQDFIDMETEGYFSFETEELGCFQFGLVQGRIDYRIEKIGDIERLEFTWEGQDENDEALGAFGYTKFHEFWTAELFPKKLWDIVFQERQIHFTGFAVFNFMVYVMNKN